MVFPTVRKLVHPKVPALLAAVLLAAGCSGSTSTTSQSGDFTIGFALGLTGLIQPFDLPSMQTAQIAMDEINSKGGVLGRKLKAVSADTHSDVNQGANAGLSVMGKGAQMVVVSCDFDFGGPAASQAQAKGLVSFSVCAGSIKFGPQGVGDKAFTMGMAAAEEGSGMAEWAYNTKGFRSAFVMHQVYNAFNDESCSSFTNRWTQLAGAPSIVGKADFKDTDPSYDSQITAVRNASKAPDFIFLCSVSPGMPKMMRAIRSAGLQQPILENQSAGGDYWKSAIPDISNVYYTDLFSINGDDPSSAINNLVTEWKTKNPQSVSVVDGHMPSGYGLIYVWSDAVKQAGSFDGAKVAKTLEGFKDHQTPIGPWTYNAQFHINLNRQMRLNQIQNGKTTFMQELRPQTLVLPSV
jgi:branched-chain amino acid transport system substrate-binding protein